MRKIKVLIIAGILFFIGKLLVDAGTFKTISNDSKGEVVELYREAFGTEDLDIDYDSGILFVSSTNRWALRSNEQVEGAIYKLEIDSGQTLTPIPHTYSSEFNPHGISFLQSDTSQFLFVVNHNSDGNFIEKFRYYNDTLYHEMSYQDEQMCCPNDVVAIDQNSFYVTNDHSAMGKKWRFLEDYLRVPMSYVLYFDGAYFSKVIERVSYANGINVSNDGTYLYLTATTSGKMYTYSIEEDGMLVLESTTKLKTGVDNIHVDPSGNIWIGAHPKLLDFVMHSSDPVRLSPSQVLKLTPMDDFEYEIDQIYLNDGSEISGSSVALPYNEEVFIGVVFENKLLRIKLNQ